MEGQQNEEHSHSEKKKEEPEGAGTSGERKQEMDKDRTGADAKDEVSIVAKFVRESGGDARKALRRYIASFSTTATHALGEAPPCRSYKALVCLSDLEEKESEIEACTTAVQILDIKNQMKPFKAAFSDLISMCKGAASRLKSSIGDVRKHRATEKIGQASAKKRGRPTKSAQHASQILVADQPHAVCTEITSIVLGEDGKPTKNWDLTAPTILRLSSKVVEETFKGLSEAMDSLAARFRADAAHADLGRMHKKLPNNIASAIESELAKAFPEGHILPQASVPESAQTLVATTSFAVAKGRMTSSAETGFLPVIRFGMRGDRRVVCVKAMPILKYLKAKGGAQTAVDMKAAYNWMKSVTQEGARAFLAENTNMLVYATVGHGDALYLPAGWVFLEVIGQSDFVGVRTQFMSTHDTEALSELSMYLVSTSTANAMLQKVVDALTIAEG